MVVPTFNSARTLDAALLSAQEQQGCETEVIVADSGSTDGTLEICSRWNVRTVYVPPGNMYQAINEGMRSLRSPWVTYLNSDDLVFADSYARLVSKGEASAADVAYGNGDFVDTQGRFLYSLEAPSAAALLSLFEAGFFGFLPHAAVIRRAVFDELGGFDQRFRHVADMEFFARACLAGKRFATIPYPSVAVFRVHPGQISRREKDVVTEELARLTRKRPVGRRLAGRLAIARWKLNNARQYALRWLRTGSFKRAR